MALNEEWKPIDRVEDQYEVSNLGRVRSVDRYVKHGHHYRFSPGCILSQAKNEKGYMVVTLNADGWKRTVGVHVLVAEAFVPNKNSLYYTVVNHKDCDPSNNSADNLEWTTVAENNKYSAKLGHYKRNEKWLENQRKGIVEKSGIPVVGKALSTGEEIRFDYLNQTREKGFSPSLVCKCCKGEQANHKGYTWRYENANE